MKIESFFKKHIFILDIVTIAIGLLLMALGSCVPSEAGVASKVMMNLIGRILPGEIFLVMMKKLHFAYGKADSRKSLKDGLLYGVPVVLYFILIQIIYSYGKAKFDITVGFIDVLYVIYYDFCVGFFEETMLRAVVFQSMKFKWKSRKYGVLLAAVISSSLFGCLHLINLITRPQLVLATISQMFYATFCGIFLCGIYMKTKNIWVPVVIHMLIDLTSHLPQALSTWFANDAIVDSSVFSSIIQTVIIIPLAILGLWCIYSASKDEQKECV